MPRRINKKVQKSPLHNRQTCIRDVANKSLTTEHCEFFLKKYGSDKVFENYLNKYYPQNGGCSFHLQSKYTQYVLPNLIQRSSFRQKQNSYRQRQTRCKQSQSLYKKKKEFTMNNEFKVREKKGNSFQFYGLKLNEIIKKTKTQYQEDNSN